MRSKYILSSVLIMRMVVFGAFAADGTVLADEGVNITCPSDYPNIDSNATSENDCWRECTTDDVANSMSVVGKNYYGSGTDTCEPTACIAGWRINPSVNLLEIIGNIDGINSAYIDNDGDFVGDITKFDGYYGIDSKNSFSVDFGDFGIVTGRALCSSVVGESGVGVWSNPLVFDSLADETGQPGASTCFCNIDGFISVDGSKRSVVSPWVGGYYFSTYTDCPQYCVRYCSYRLSTLENFRVKMFEQIDTLSPVCTEDVYRCVPGQYLRVTDFVAECVECPEGAYCPGGDFTLFSEYKGINSCPSDYPNSDAGSSADTSCYTSCDIKNISIEKATAVTGRDYYGFGADTCKISECIAGWEVKQHKSLYDIIGTGEGTNSAYISYSGIFQNGVGRDFVDREYYGMTKNNTWVAGYGDLGIVKGRAFCSKSYTYGGSYNDYPDETGQTGARNCYCRVEEYTNSEKKVQSVSAPWVLVESYSDQPWADGVSSCQSSCVNSCAADLRLDGTNELELRKKLFSTAPVTYICEEITYTLNPGEYLPAGGEEPVDCPSGYYCPGVGDVRWDEKNDQGLVVCPVDYPNSDTDAKSENQCYKQCTTDDVAGAMTVVGTDYYGGLNTCDATECVAGWRLKPGLNLKEFIGETAGTNSARINNTGSYGESAFGSGGSSKGQGYYGISDKNSFAVYYAGKGILTGHGRCSTVAGNNNNDTWTNPTIVNALADETGQSGAQYCYCQIDGFTSTGGNKTLFTSESWVFHDNFASVSHCSSDCAGLCADWLAKTDDRIAFRSAVFGAGGHIPAICEENGTYLPDGATEYVRCPDGYDNSDAGATSENQCYKQCTTDDVAGAMTVVGRNYYGDGTDTCDATECVAGWRLKSGETLADIIGGYSSVNSAIIGWNSQYTGSFNEWNRDNLGAKGEEYYGITENNTFAWDYGDLGMVYGRALCSSKYATTFDELTDETGGSNAIHCYCRFDGYKPVGENKQNVTASWVYSGTYGSSCSSSCIFNCGNNGAYSAMLNTEQITFGTCTEIIYTLNPGEYLPVGGEEPADCPNGSYCPGAGDVKYDEEKDQGLVACPVDYPNSDTGAKTENQCYKQCTTDDVAGAMTVVGRNYYGDGTDTCDATECVAGWRLKSGKTLVDVIGTEPGINSASVNSMGSFIEVNYDNLGTKGQSYYGLNDNMSFAVDYGERGMVMGKSLCSTKGGTGSNDGVSSVDQITRFDELVDETSGGTQYCYCTLDNYTPYGGVKQTVSTPWFLYDNVSACGLECSKYCASNLRHLSTSSFLAQALFGAAELAGDTCEENGTYLPDGATEYVKCPDGYDNSDIGATSENQCYKQCTTDDVAGAMTVVGTDYYGGLNTCAATQCLADWILQDLSGHIGNVNGVDSAFISTDSSSYGEFYEDDLGNDGLKGQDYYGISEPGTFAVDYGDMGIITGRALCSTKPGTNNDYTWTNPTVFDELTDETGQSGADYCYCQVDSFISTSGLVQILSGMPWVYYDSCSGNGVSKCEQSCATLLRQNSSSDLAFRSAIFGYSTCEEGMYRMKAGIYLPAGASDAVICPSGSYCPGADNVKLNEDKDQGLVACPMDYPNSDIGATSENQCYKQCTTDDVANSMTVTGKNYYGDGYDSCAATQCLADWKLQDLYGIVGDTEGVNSAYISTNSSSYGEFVEYDNHQGQDYYGISEPGEFAVDYGDMGVITGRARCSTKPGTNNDYAWTDPTMFAELPDESSVDGARYCYCQVDSYTPVGGLTQVLSGMPWVFRGEERSKDNCNNSCAHYCMYQLMENYTEALAFRSAVFGYASCDEEVYRVNPGDYLPEGADAPSDCPPGSYCSGAEDISSRPSKAQGVNTCPAEYPYSDSGAKSKNSCYRDCTSDDVANSMTVVGRNYYGDGVDTCEPTDCVAGWHLKLGLNLEDLIGSTYEGANSEYMAGENSAYIDNNGSFVEYNTADNGDAKGQEYYGITSNNSFAVGYGDSGMIRGHSICSTQSDDIVDDLTDESDNTDATNCYCRIEEYISADGVKQNVAASWVKWGNINWYPGACESNCVQYCSTNMREHMYLDFRGKMFEASMEIPMCLANKININWNLGYGDNNSSTTTCSYNEVIVLPQEPVRPGYIFTGWKVLKSNQ